MLLMKVGVAVAPVRNAWRRDYWNVRQLLLMMLGSAVEIVGKCG